MSRASETTAILTGSLESHLETLSGSKMRVHREVLKPLERLQKKAARAGFDLAVVSAFRGFDAQLRIWNEKAVGKRPLLDRQNRPLDPSKMSPKDIVYAILGWSALPGASRHHWGTDVDVIDRLTVPPRYQVQLTSQETGPGGIFCALHDWLDRHMAEEGFYRPYVKDLGGVQPERWHLSHAETAQPLYEAHSEEVLREKLAGVAMELKDTVLAELPEIFDRFFLRVHAP